MESATQRHAVAGVDFGKTRCRLRVLLDDGDRLEEEGRGFPGLAGVDGVEHAASSVVALLARLLQVRPAALGVGVAGALAAPRHAARLATRLADDLECPVMVTSDVVTAHAGALAGHEGTVLVAGTGAIAVGIDHSGMHRVDGWGPHLGDLGSGCWIGREGLLAVLSQLAGRGPKTELVQRAARLGDIVANVAGAANPALVLADFAPDVLAAAPTDAVAADIAARAVGHLVRSAHAASPRDPRVASVGGLTDSSWFLEQLHRGLRVAGLEPREPKNDALDGARELALASNPIYERWLHRAG